MKRLNNILEDLIYNANITKWTLDNHGVKQYYEIVANSNPQYTIVQSLICARLDGNSGFYTPKHLVSKIGKSIVSLDDTMISFLTIKMNSLVKSILYLDMLNNYMDGKMVDDTIDEFLENSKSSTEINV